jgi:FtsZ-binding cell division protein ZapB
MELQEIKRSTTIMTSAGRVEEMRQALNGAYSVVPLQLAEVFGAALDQVADQQVKVTAALIRLIEVEDLREAENSIKQAATEAQRAALRAARAYADHQADEARRVRAEVGRIPADATDLLRTKQAADSCLERAVQLHEKDNSDALQALFSVASQYEAWCSEAQLHILGSEAIVASDRRKVCLQVLAIGAALLLGIVNIVINILRK